MKRLVDIRELNEQARVIDDLKCVSRPQLAPSPRSRVVGRQRSRARGPGARDAGGDGDPSAPGPSSRPDRVRVHALVYVVVFC